jgi:hypothetical protein
MCINYVYAYKMRIKIVCDSGIIFGGREERAEALTLYMGDKI